MDWSNMANPIFLFGYKRITLIQFCTHSTKWWKGERENKTNGISWSLHSILFFCFNFVSEFNVCTRQLMALTEKWKKKNVKAPNHTLNTVRQNSSLLLKSTAGLLPLSFLNHLSIKGQGILYSIGQGCLRWQCWLFIFMSTLGRSLSTKAEESQALRCLLNILKMRLPVNHFTSTVCPVLNFNF